LKKSKEMAKAREDYQRDTQGDMYEWFPLPRRPKQSKFQAFCILLKQWRPDMPSSASPIIMAALMMSNLIGASARLIAQQSAPDIPSLTLRANTRLVVVDIVFTDKKG
jgi:hypothetical protein